MISFSFAFRIVQRRPRQEPAQIISPISAQGFQMPNCQGQVLFRAPRMLNLALGCFAQFAVCGL